MQQTIDTKRAIKEAERLEGALPAPKLRQIVRYWLSLCSKNKFPSRSDVDPFCIPNPLLPHIVLTDIEREPFRLKMRLVGTHVAEAFTPNLNGQYIDEVFPDFENTNAYKQRKLVADTGVPQSYSGRGELDYRLEYQDVHWVHLPLAADGVRPDIIFGGLVVRYDG